MKVAIIGYSGSGKSTLAKAIHDKYQLPLLYLDTIQFESNWQERDRTIAKNMVQEFLQKDSWVIDGNYTSFFQSERLQQADHIIFMDFSRWACLHRAYHRYKTFQNQTRDSITDGCDEKMDWEFITWILFNGRTKAKRIKYKEIQKVYHDKVITIHNQKELDAFYIHMFD